MSQIPTIRTWAMTMMTNDEDADYRVIFHCKIGHSSSSGSGAADVASGSGVAGVDAPHSGDANVEAHESRAANVEGTPVRAGDEPTNESQIMLTVTSHRASGNSGDGMLSQRDMIDTQVEAATESSVKRCGAQLVNNLAYQRCKKLRLPSPLRPDSPVEPTLPSKADINLSVKKIVAQDLGIRVAEKGAGEIIPPPLSGSRIHAGELSFVFVLLLFF